MDEINKIQAKGIDPVESDIGKRVVYLNPYCKIQYGVITSFNKHFVFVKYDNTGSTSQATDRKDLDWET